MIYFDRAAVWQSGLMCLRETNSNLVIEKKYDSVCNRLKLKFGVNSSAALKNIHIYVNK
jgi:hypothetical protein